MKFKLLFHSIIGGTLFVALTSCSSNFSVPKTQLVSEPEPTFLASSATDGRWIITAGFGIASIHLGMAKDEVIRQLGEPRSSLPKGCAGELVSSFQWFKSFANGDVEDGNGIFVYLRENSVFLISFSSPRFATYDGKTYGTPWEKLEERKEDIEFFTLTRSSSNATNGENRIFGIDKQSGLAFGAGADSKGQRIVNEIYVFGKDMDFESNFCIGIDQALIPINDRPSSLSK